MQRRGHWVRQLRKWEVRTAWLDMLLVALAEGRERRTPLLGSMVGDCEERGVVGIEGRLYRQMRGCWKFLGTADAPGKRRVGGPSFPAPSPGAWGGLVEVSI